MLKGFALAAAALVGLVALAAVGLPRLVDSVALRTWVAQAAGQAVGRPVTVASISLRLLPLPTIQLRGIEIADEPAFGGGPMLSVGDGRIALRLWPLLRGSVEARGVTLSDARLEIVEDARGRLNVATLGPAPPGPVVPPRPGAARPAPAPPAAGLAPRVEITDATIRYRRLGARPVEITARGVTGTIIHEAPSAPVRVSGHARLEPSGARLALVDVTVLPASGRPLAEWALGGAVDVEASDAAAVVRSAVGSPEVQGAARGRFQLAGTLARPRATGALTLDRATVVEERRRCGERPRRQLLFEDIRVPVSAAPPLIDSAPVTARLAGGRVSLGLGVRLDGGPSVAVKDLRIEGVEASAILLDYLCQPWAVRGPLDLTGQLTLRGPDYLETAAGSGRLKVGRGTVTGSDVTAVVGEVQALTGAAAGLVKADRNRTAGRGPLDFESITATYTVAGGVIRSDDLLYEAREFRISGVGTYALADGRVSFEATFVQGDNRVRATIAGPPGALRITATSIRIREGRDLKRLLDRLLR